jgi:hypothetical protein
MRLRREVGWDQIYPQAIVTLTCVIFPTPPFARYDGIVSLLSILNSPRGTSAARHRRNKRQEPANRLKLVGAAVFDRAVP